MNIFATETKILLHPMSLTVQIGSSVTFDCAGQDDATGPVVYQWGLFGNDRATIDRVNFRVSDFTSLTIPNFQFTTQYAGVLCVFGIERAGSSLSVSNDANITLVG